MESASGAPQVQGLAPYDDGLADAKVVSTHHEQRQKMPHAMAILLACFKEPALFAVWSVQTHDRIRKKRPSRSRVTQR